MSLESGLARDTQPLHWSVLTKEETQIIHNVSRLILSVKREHEKKPKKVRTQLKVTPWADPERDRFNNIILLDGHRGSGKTSLLLTMIRAWRSIESLSAEDEDRKENRTFFTDIESMSNTVRCLKPLDFDTLPTDLPLYNWIIQAFEPLVNVVGGREGNLDNWTDDSTPQSLREQFRKLQNTATLGWTTGLLTQALANNVGDFIVWHGEQQSCWQNLERDWLAFQDCLFEKLENADGENRLPHGAVIVLPIDDLDLQSKRVRELLLALRILRHNRLVYMLTGDSDNLDLCLKAEFYGDYVQAAASLSEHIKDEIREQGDKLASGLSEKTIPYSHRFKVNGIKLFDLLNWKPSQGKTIRTILGKLWPTESGFTEKLEFIFQNGTGELTIPFRTLQGFYDKWENISQSTELKGAKEFCDLLVGRHTEDGLRVGTSESRIELTKNPCQLAPAPRDYVTISGEHNVLLNSVRTLDFAMRRQAPPDMTEFSSKTPAKAAPLDEAALPGYQLALDFAASFKDTVTILAGPRLADQVLGLVWSSVPRGKDQTWLLPWPMVIRPQCPAEWFQANKRWNAWIAHILAFTEKAVPDSETLLEAWLNFNASPMDSELPKSANPLPTFEDRIVTLTSKLDRSRMDILSQVSLELYGLSNKARLVINRSTMESAKAKSQPTPGDLRVFSWDSSVTDPYRLAMRPSEAGSRPDEREIENAMKECGGTKPQEVIELNDRQLPSFIQMSRQDSAIAEAECIAWPFVDIVQFRGVQTTCPTRDEQDGLAARLAALGCRELTADLTRSAWRHNEQLDCYVGRIARILLQLSGRTFGLTSDQANPGHEILAWRWISLALPVDLLIAARVPDPNSTITDLRLLDPTLRVLEPTAHLHVHATAALPFSRVWTGMSDELDLSDVKTAPCGFPIEEWKAWLRRAFAARSVLEVWMNKGKNVAFALLDAKPEVKRAMGDLLSGKCRFEDRADEASVEGFVRMRRTSALCRIGGHNEAIQQKRFRESDVPNPEIMFNRRCLFYMHHNADDKRFLKLWIQRTRIRAMMFRHLVHDPAQRGLDSFATCFKRIDEYGIDRLAQEVVSVASKEPGIKLEAVELRGAPSRLSKLLDGRIRSRQQASPSVDSSCPSISWVLHFIRDKKSRDGTAQGIIRSHYVTAEKMILTLKHQPDLLRSVRAIDVASRELSGPLWYLAGPIHRVLDASRMIASRERDLQGLHLTVHAGEDFRHLLSGLRFIHEPFWWGLMRRGDRIGHALALGLEPKQWCEEHPVVTMPRHERMLDLAWMLSFISTRKLHGVSPATILGAQEELSDHLKLWKVDGATLPDFIELAKNLGRRGIWSQINAPHWTSLQFEHSTILKLLKRLIRLRDDSSPSEMIEVATGQDWKDLREIRDELARLLAKWRTPIEINPSSNLLVGGMKYVMDQPLFHLDASDKSEMRGLVLTLSADDPLCFATTLSDEFAYAWAGMVIGADLPSAYAQEWLERAARAGRRAAFGSREDSCTGLRK